MNIMIEMETFKKQEERISSERILIPLQSAIELTPFIDYNYYIENIAEFPFNSKAEIVALVKNDMLEKKWRFSLTGIKEFFKSLAFINYISGSFPLGIYNVGDAETTWEIEENSTSTIAKLMLTNITNVANFKGRTLAEVKLNKLTKKIEIPSKDSVQYINRDDIQSFSPSSKSYLEGMSLVFDTMLFNSTNGSHSISSMIVSSDLATVPVKINFVSCTNNDVVIDVFRKFMEV